MKEINSAESVTEAFKKENYICDSRLAFVIYLALSMEKPLLLEGEPGVGKTEVAKVLANVLGRKLIRLQCYEGLDAATTIYEWNYAKQLLKIKTVDVCSPQGYHLEDIFTDEYLIPRPLLTAIRSHEKTVLLIDEIDRADEEFEAFLLEILSDFQISIPEMGTVKATHKPQVIVTSNRVRELHDALKRRCLYHWVGYPDAQRELEIVKARRPLASDALAKEVVHRCEDRVLALRDAVQDLARCRDAVAGFGHRLASLEREAGQAALQAEDLSRRLALSNRVPCSGMPMQGQCTLLSDAREAAALAPSAQQRIRQLAAERDSLRLELQALQEAVSLNVGAPQSLSRAECQSRRALARQTAYAPYSHFPVGAAGLTAAAGGAQFGARTVLIEKSDRLGGDCLHFGCVPSKTLIRTAGVWSLARRTADFGLPRLSLRPVDLGAVMDRVQSVVDAIQHHDSPERFCGLGAEVRFGAPRFRDDHVVELDGRRRELRNTVQEVNRRDIIRIFRGVFTGSHARHPKVDMIPAASLTILGNPPLRVMADGELVGETPLRVVVRPRALTILA